VSRVAPSQKPGRSKQDYGTPLVFLAAVKRRFGIAEFAIDLAASAENAVAPMFYTEAENALHQPWRTKSRELAWCNPPFSNIGPWVEKAWAESRKGARVAMLLPAGVGSNWWRDHVHGKAFVLLLNGRLTFAGETQPYPKDCVLLVYGPDVAPGYEVWSWAAKPQKAVA
jgi:phage N-6-adenine-methyltransferase